MVSLNIQMERGLKNASKEEASGVKIVLHNTTLVSFCWKFCMFDFDKLKTYYYIGIDTNAKEGTCTGLRAGDIAAGQS